MLRRAGFFGRMLVGAPASSATGCSRATCSRSSGRRWNYRNEDGGGMILDMMCHWRYVLDNLFGEVKSRLLPRRDAHPAALGRERQALRAPPPTTRPTRPFELVGHNGEPVIAQLNMSWATRVRRDDLRHLPRRRHARLGGRRPARLPGAAARQHAAAGVEPGREADDELLRRSGRRCRHAGLRQRLQDPVGALHPPRRRGRALPAGRCPKAPRACSSSRPRCRAGRSGAGSTCRRSRC